MLHRTSSRLSLVQITVLSSPAKHLFLALHVNCAVLELQITKLRIFFFFGSLCLVCQQEEGVSNCDLQCDSQCDSQYDLHCNCTLKNRLSGDGSCPTNTLSVNLLSFLSLYRTVPRYMICVCTTNQM